MEQDFKDAKALIEHSHRILLTMHERMDGDDGGSVLAMNLQLEKLGKKTVCAIRHQVPPQLKFLPGSEKIVDDITTQDFDLVIMFGCSNKQRCSSEKIINLKAPVINIDHHPDNEFFGQINLVDKEKSSVAELVYDFFKFCHWPITKDIATCLLTGIITDTGSFRHSNTQVSTLETAAALLRKGALTDSIIKHTFKSKSPLALKAWGLALENSYYDEEQKILYSVVTEKDLQKIGKLPQAVFEGFVETLNAVPEAKFVMFLRQDGEIIKGSLRSDSFKKVDVAEIAKMFGGGGHKQAAGFSVVGKLEKDDAGKWKVI